MTIVGEAQVRVGADTSTFDRDVTTGLNKTASGLSGVGTTIAKGLAIGTAAVGVLGAAAFANTQRVGEMADSLMDLSAVTGASTDQLQEWRFVAAKTGQGTDFFGDSVKQLNRTMTQIEAGTGKASNALDRLGVSTRDSAGNMKSSAQITNDAIVALSGMTDVSLRAQLATDIFSRKANELIPVLDEGAAGLEAMKLQAHELGGVLSEDALRAADHFRESLAVLHTQVTGVGNAVGANLAPVLDSLVQFVSNKVLPIVISLSERFGAWWTTMQDGPGIMANIKDAIGNLFSGDTITNVMGGIQGAIQTGIESAATWIRSGGLTSLVESFLSGRAAFLTAGLDLLVALIGGISRALPTIIQFVVGDLIPDLVNSLLTAIPLILDAAVTLFSTLLTAASTILPGLIGTLLGTVLPGLLTSVVGMIPDLIDAALGLFSSLVTALVTVIPVLIKTLTGTVIPNLITAIVDAVPMLIDAALSLVLGLVTGIVDALPLVIDAITTAIPLILGALADAIPKLLEGGIDLVLGLLDGIVKALPLILTAVIGAIPKIITSLVAMAPRLTDAGIKLVVGLLGGIVQALPQIVQALIRLIPQIMIAFRDAWPQLIDAGKEIIGSLLSGVLERAPAIWTWFAALPGTIGGWLSTAGSWLWETGKDILFGLLGGIQDFQQSVVDWFLSLPGKMLDLVKGAGTWLIDAGKSIMSGLLSGIKDGFESIKSYVSGIGSKIASLKGPEEYDRKLLVPAGGWIMSGLEKGLLAGLPSLRQALSEVTDAIQFSPTIPAIGTTSTGGSGSSIITVENVNVQITVSGAATPEQGRDVGTAAAEAFVRRLAEARAVK